MNFIKQYLIIISLVIATSRQSESVPEVQVYKFCLGLVVAVQAGKEDLEHMREFIVTKSFNASNADPNFKAVIKNNGDYDEMLRKVIEIIAQEMGHGGNIDTREKRNSLKKKVKSEIQAYKPPIANCTFEEKVFAFCWANTKENTSKTFFENIFSV